MIQCITVQRDGRLTIFVIDRPEAYSASKATANEELATGFDIHVEPEQVGEWSYSARRMMIGSYNAVYGPAAFAEKRVPAWVRH